MSVRKKIDSWLKSFEHEFLTHNIVEISREAFEHNIAFFRESTQHPIIPVLKSNAYGHGIEQVALALKETTDFPYIAVDSYYEALRIREVSLQPVLIMGAIDPRNFPRMHYDKFAFVVQDSDTIQALDRVGKPLKVHLEINTGMNRYGAKPTEALSLAQKIHSSRHLELEGLMSHLADSAGNNQETIDQPVSVYDQLVEELLQLGIRPPLLHLAQSAGSLRARSHYANTIRLGIGIYGINPFTPNHPLYTKLGNALQPALRLTSTLTKITELQTGDKISYSYTYTAQRPMRIGVLPLGYYEALDREALSNRGIVKINDQYAPIVGQICMNHTMINLDKIDAQVGDTVIVYSNVASNQNSIDSLARNFGLFNYSMLTSISPEIRRKLTGLHGLKNQAN